MKKKEKICPDCNKPIEQGHRCETKYPKTYIVSNNGTYIPSDYNGKTFERIEDDDSFAFATSGARVSRAKWISSLIALRDSVEEIIKEVAPDVIKDKEKDN